MNKSSLYSSNQKMLNLTSVNIYGSNLEIDTSVNFRNNLSIKKWIFLRIHRINANPNKTENLLADLIVEAWEGALIRMKSSKNKKPLEQFVEFSLPRILAMRTEH